MRIKGYVHITEDEAFLADVNIVQDVRFYVGQVVGTMELSNSDDYVLVKKHPCGNYNGQIIKA